MTVEEEEEYPFILQLARLARVCTENASQLTQDQKSQVFQILEQAIENGTDEEAAVVFTGFFDSILNRWDKGFDLESVWPYVGQRARAYCLSVNEMWGIESPDWMRQN